MNGKGLFDHQDEALLIELVRQQPSLWNAADSNYQKKGLKKILYMHIAEELKKRSPDKAKVLTADSVRHKFNVLRGYFQREQKKMKTWDKVSTVRMFPKWIHFDKMLFLIEKEGKNESDCDLNVSTERVEEEISTNDKEMEHNSYVTEASWSDSNEGKDSFLLWPSPIQSNKGILQPVVKVEVPDDTTSCSNGNVGTDSSLSMQSPVQSNERVLVPSIKIEVSDDSSPVCTSLMTEISDYAVVAQTSISDSNKRTYSSLSLQSNKNAPGPFLKKQNPNHSPPLRGSLNFEVPVNSIFAEACYSDGSEETDSVLPSQPLVQTNLACDEPTLKRKKLIDSSPVCDSTEKETPVIAEVSCSNNNGRTYSSTSLQSNGKAADPLLKQKKLLLLHQVNSPLLEQRPLLVNKRNELSNASSMCDSTKTKTPRILNAWSAQEPPSFNVALGNLVTASLNQMPVDKVNAATREILDILLKYGKETNHLR